MHERRNARNRLKPSRIVDKRNKSEPPSTDPALNSTGASQAVALALMALLPGISAARLASNHNRTRLRD